MVFDSIVPRKQVPGASVSEATVPGTTIGDYVSI